ncbi:MAG: SDR family NAD(P)-dependent oxidoreductase [Candidatus Gastranaerophilales bacterium]|nr:SDR family NAD(P)-dependent oxidoreductase [Candidatus Gastranaerophilales bacterium]
MGKNILVIASTSELAQRTITELKNQGYNIYTTSRHAAGVMEEGVIEYKLNVADEYDFIHLKEKLSSVQFDTIINFAGIAIAGAVDELSEIELKKQLDVNLFGLLRIIKYLCPNLAKEGKLINVSSMASYGIFPFLSPYCISKASADILLNTYSIETGIKTVSIRPGAVATKFWESSIELNKDTLKDKSKYNKEKEFIVKNANKNSLHAANPIAVAKKITNIVNLKNPKTVYNLGLDSKLAKCTRFLPQGIINSIVRFTLKKRIKKG